MSIQIDNDELVQGENTLGFGQQRIIQTTAGVLYTCQINDLGYVEVHKSINDGMSWSLETTFTDTNNPLFLSMCKSELDDIFLCFTNNTTYTLVKRRHYSTGVWSEVKNENRETNGGYPIGSMIHYNSAVNRLHLFTISNKYVASPLSNNLQNWYSDDYGATWTAGTGRGTTNATTVPFTVWGLSSDKNTGDVYIALWDVSGAIGSGSSISANRFNSSGVFQTPTILSSAYVWGRATTADASGNIYNMLVRGASGSTQSLWVYKGTATQILNMTLDGTTPPIAYGEHCIGCDNLNNVYIFYTKKADSYCYYRKYTATTETWSDEAVFSKDGDGNPIVGRRPSCVQLTANASDKLHVIFSTV